MNGRGPSSQGGGANHMRVARDQMTVRAGTVIGTGQQPTISARHNLVKVNMIHNLNDGETAHDTVLEIGATLGGTYFIEDEFFHEFTVGGLLGVTGDSDIRSTLWAEVPAGYFYRIRNVTGTATINWVRERVK